ncbi:hypothetical protein Gpo141_00009517 [Globisporangium polare]
MDAHGRYDTVSAPALAVSPPSCCDADRGAGVAVLTTQVLWELITSFQPGYPRAVHVFYKTSNPVILERLCEEYAHYHDSSIGKLAKRGLLPHLAIAANNLHVLRVLYKLRSSSSTSVQYQRDPKLSFSKAMRCAVVCHDIEALECILELRGSKDRQWESNLLRIAIQREHPDLRVLDWLVARLPEHLSIAANEPYFERDILHHTESGNQEAAGAPAQGFPKG